MSKCIICTPIQCNPIVHIFIVTVAPIIIFSKSKYSIDEDAGPAQPVLVLSNPPSTNITVQVRSNNITATGE